MAKKRREPQTAYAIVCDNGNVARDIWQDNLEIDPDKEHLEGRVRPEKGETIRRVEIRILPSKSRKSDSAKS